MNVLIRTDASSVIGTGHVSRCLALAEELVLQGADVTFACRELPGSLCRAVEKAGHALLRLPALLGGEGGEFGADDFTTGTGHSARLPLDWEADARACLAAGSVDWVVVDHYGLARRWETAMRGAARSVMVIDDLADRPHDCDLLTDCNLHPDPVGRYAGLTPPDCRMLVGPAYAPLRAQFREARNRLRARGPVVRRLLVFFGGNNPHRATEKAFRALALRGDPGFEVDFLLGPNFPGAEDFVRMAAPFPWANILRGVEDMAGLMSRTDLFLGAGGVTTWERACMALPSLVAATAENQVEPSQTLSLDGRQVYLGHISDLSPEDIASGLRRTIEDPGLLAGLSRIGELVDGQGTRRVAQAMAGDLPQAGTR